MSVVLPCAPRDACQYLRVYKRVLDTLATQDVVKIELSLL
jgi:hypothetical protein